jgi:hypothetical protein
MRLTAGEADKANPLRGDAQERRLARPFGRVAMARANRVKLREPRSGALIGTTCWEYFATL